MFFYYDKKLLLTCLIFSIPIPDDNDDGDDNGKMQRESRRRRRPCIHCSSRSSMCYCVITVYYISIYILVIKESAFSLKKVTIKRKIGTYNIIIINGAVYVFTFLFYFLSLFSVCCVLFAIAFLP